MAFTNVGCVSAVVAFATQAWPAGSKTVGPVAIADKFRYGWLLVDLTALTTLTCSIQVTMDLSMDGGATWTGIGGWGLNVPMSGYALVGGVLVDAANQPIRITGASMRLPDASSVLRQVRATASLSTPATVGCTLVIW